jgi:hypothetical protein
MSSRLTTDLLRYQFHANNMVGVSYDWRGEHNRAIKHYAMALTAAKKIAMAEIEDAEEHELSMENGEWTQMAQFKLGLFPLMAQLYARDRAAKNPVKYRVVEHTSIDAAATANGAAAAMAASFGFEIQPHHQNAISNVQAIAITSEQVDWVSAKEMTSKMFEEEYLKLNRPVVIGKGLIESWPAKQKWTAFDLIASYGALEFKVGNGPQPSDLGKTLNKEEKADLKEFTAWLKDQETHGYFYNHEEGTMVKNEGKATEEKQKLEPGAPPGFKTTTKVNRKGVKTMTLTQFIDEVMKGKEQDQPELRYIFNTMEKSKLRDDFTIPDVIHKVTPEPTAANEDYTTEPGVFEFTIGPAGSGSHPHVHYGAWNALVHGRKRWIMWAPSVLKEHDVNVTMPAVEFFTDVLPIMTKRNEQIYEFIQEAGEIVFVPDQWGHAVLNLEPSVGASRQLPRWRYGFDLSWLPSAVHPLTSDWVASQGSKEW